MIDSAHIAIKTEEKLNHLCNSIKNGVVFADSFSFENESLLHAFFDNLSIDITNFNEKTYYYNEEKEIHITKNEANIYWISTMGLVPQEKLSINKYFNSLSSQHWVMITLIEKVRLILSGENIYFAESYYQEKVAGISQALFGNTVLYCELLGKAYLSIDKNDRKTIREDRIAKIRKGSDGHRLGNISTAVRDVLYENGHNNTYFHFYYAFLLKSMSEYLRGLPGFKEAYIKYDDNLKDFTVVSLSKSNLALLEQMISNTYTAVYDFYFGFDQDCFTQGYFEYLLSQAKTDEQMQYVKTNYVFLIAAKETI